MSYEDMQSTFGDIIKSEARRRYRAVNKVNLSWEDLIQEATLTAWQYCRDREAPEVDGGTLRMVIRRALYRVAVKSHGIHLGNKVYTDWAAQTLDCGVRALCSLEGITEQDSCAAMELLPARENTENAVMFLVFVDSLPAPERRVLFDLMENRRRGEQAVSSRMQISRKEARQAICHLRRIYAAWA